MQRFPASIPGFFRFSSGFFTRIWYSLIKQSSSIRPDQADSQQAVVPAIDDLQASRASQSGKAKEKTLVAVSLAFFLFIIIKDGWLSDDAYITFRTVDNFIHGFGLTWNIDERVQVYTHPLWMFFLSVVYFCTRQIYYSALLLSIAISFIAIAIFALYLAKSPYIAAMGILILAASKSFVDYSTSGLENPLTHLLIVLFMLVFYSDRRNTRSIFWLSLIAALAALNRMDTLLLFAPPLIYKLYKSPTFMNIKAALLGFLPFVFWEAFSLWYYGFLFPNTAYAKLDTGIGAAQLLHQGIGYFISSAKFDPILFIIIAAGFSLTFISREWRNIPFLLGIILYFLYTLKIGGDFMAGRFLTAPFLIVMILLIRGSYPSLKWIWIPVLAGVVFFGFLTPDSRWYPIITSNVMIDGRGVADERAAYVDATGILNALRGIQMPNSPYAQGGLQARFSNQKVAVVLSRIGFFGFEAGPYVHVVDRPALADPLLARLPSQPHWRIGHFHRGIPAGYLETLESGTDVIKSKELALYYAKLRYVTSGPLFDLHRLIEIWKLNTGAYDYLLKAYNDHPLTAIMISKTEHVLLTPKTPSPSPPPSPPLHPPPKQSSYPCGTTSTASW